MTAICATYTIMAPGKKNIQTTGPKLNKKYHEDKEIVPIKIMPGGIIGARYKDDEFSLIRDAQGKIIPYKLFTSHL